MADVPSSADFEMAAEGIALRDLFGQPGRLVATPGFLQKLINVVQPGARENALVTDVLEASHQVTEQVHFQLVAWREIGVAAFGREGMIAAMAVGVKSRLA